MTDGVHGDATGLPLPVDAAALAAAGPDWLTRAGHAWGALPTGNRVAAITAIRPVAAGNSGQKARLAIAYARPDPALPAELFVKFSRDPADPFRDRRRAELEAEIRLARLARHPAFPVRTARAFFGDFHAASGTGLLVSEAIRFGEGAIEPCHEKAMDHRLADPLAHYHALVDALGALGGTHRAGALSPEAEALFPFAPAAAAAELPITLDAAGLAAAIARFAAFARACPALVPPKLADPAFHARLAADAARFLAREADVRAFLHADPRFIALLHWNAHIDNAWFERRDSGLACGLLDWGMARQMNVGIALWGCLSGMPRPLLLAEVDRLLARFAAAFAAAGGPPLPPAELARHFELAVMLLTLSLMITVADLATARVPAIAAASGLDDPLLLAEPVTRGFLHVALNALALWQARDFGARLAQFG